MFENFHGRSLLDLSSERLSERNKILIGLDGDNSNRIYFREIPKNGHLETNDFENDEEVEGEFIFTNISFEAAISELYNILDIDIEIQIATRIFEGWITNDAPKIVKDKKGNKYLSVGVQVLGCSGEGKFFYRKNTYFSAKFLARYMYYFYEYVKNTLDPKSVHIPEKTVEEV